jgi:hypothetical protein
MNYPAHRAGHLNTVLTAWEFRPICLNPLCPPLYRKGEGNLVLPFSKGELVGFVERFLAQLT